MTAYDRRACPLATAPPDWSHRYSGSPLSHENGQNGFTAEQDEQYGAAFGVDPARLMFGDEQSGPEVKTGAVALSSSAVLAALVHTLHDKGALSGEETVEIYEQALLLLEQGWFLVVLPSTRDF